MSLWVNSLSLCKLKAKDGKTWNAGSTTIWIIRARRTCFPYLPASVRAYRLKLEVSSVRCFRDAALWDSRPFALVLKNTWSRVWHPLLFYAKQSFSEYLAVMWCAFKGRVYYDQLETTALIHFAYSCLSCYIKTTEASIVLIFWRRHYPLGTCHQIHHTFAVLVIYVFQEEIHGWWSMGTKDWTC